MVIRGSGAWRADRSVQQPVHVDRARLGIDDPVVRNAEACVQVELGAAVDASRVWRDDFDGKRGAALDSAVSQHAQTILRHERQVRLDDGAIGQDDVDAIPLLHRLGLKFAETIDWQAILDGSDERFLIRPGRTLPAQYQTA